MTVTTRLYWEGRLEERDFDPERVAQELRRTDALLWVDIDDPSEANIAMLGKEFGFHELALEDCLHPHQRPKIEQYGSYFFLIAYATNVEGPDVISHEVAIFVGRNYLVTVRKPPQFDLADVLKRWDAHSDLADEGGGYLLYVLLDEVVDGYFDTLDAYEDSTEAIEERVFAGLVESDTQSQIFLLRKELVELRRIVSPMREVLDVMQRRTIDVVTAGLEPYYRDVYDHVLRATDFLDSLRDILASALEANLSVVSNRLNEVMKQLTSWAAIILIPTLVAGIYGMNFVNMPELRWRYGYAYALALMFGSAYLLYRMFKRRNWL
ncbi:MAG TPA: magnesium/cobalt transporter CorA [Actinomycetota bacterium]